MHATPIHQKDTSSNKTHITLSPMQLSSQSVHPNTVNWYLNLHSFFSEYCSGFCSASNMDCMEGSTAEINGIHTKHGYNSSSNSNTSSIGSISSSSSDSDHKMTAGARELEADADSLTCRQSGLSSNDQSENDCTKMVLHYPKINSF